MGKTFYAIKHNNLITWHNANDACYAEIFPAEYSLSKKLKENVKNTFVLFIPKEYLIGGFKNEKVFSTFLKFIKELIPFKYKFKNKLNHPSCKKNGYEISFDCDKLTAKQIKIGAYLIRLAWEIVPIDFADCWYSTYLKYKNKFSGWQILKYLFFTFGCYGKKDENLGYYCVFSGHMPHYNYKLRNFKDDFLNVFNLPFNTLWTYIFTETSKFYPSIPFSSINNPHTPQSFEDAIDNLEKYITNPQKELDK